MSFTLRQEAVLARDFIPLRPIIQPSIPSGIPTFVYEMDRPGGDTFRISTTVLYSYICLCSLCECGT